MIQRKSFLFVMNYEWTRFECKKYEMILIGIDIFRKSLHCSAQTKKKSMVTCRNGIIHSTLTVKQNEKYFNKSDPIAFVLASLLLKST